MVSETGTDQDADDEVTSRRLPGEKRMQLLLIICRESLENKVLELLEDGGVEGYTVIRKVHGAGKTGIVPYASEWAGLNTLMIVVAPDTQAQSIATKLKGFSRRQSDREKGRDMPLKLISWPCDILI